MTVCFLNNLLAKSIAENDNKLNGAAEEHFNRSIEFFYFMRYVARCVFADLEDQLRIPFKGVILRK